MFLMEVELSDLKQDVILYSQINVMFHKKKKKEKKLN